MRNIKSFFLNLRDIKDYYVRKNFEKIENKINELETAKTEQTNTGQQASQSSQGSTNLQSSTQSENTVIRLPIEQVSALRAVRSTSSVNIAKADPNGGFEDAVVLGVSIQTGFVGVKTTVKIFGELKDPFFNYPLYDKLYLATDGAITNTPPATETFQTTIGYSLGQGAIFIDIKEPIQIN